MHEDAASNGSLPCPKVAFAAASPKLLMLPGAGLFQTKRPARCFIGLNGSRTFVTVGIRAIAITPWRQAMMHKRSVCRKGAAVRLLSSCPACSFADLFALPKRAKCFCPNGLNP
ncbi:MAG: hypothetical protein Q4A28_02580 [Brachymonas sp.]|nr:hypothetical protein [Brachymonas sp.]